eukprot:g36476.t1
MNAIYKFADDSTVEERRRKHPIDINRAEVERVDSIKFLQMMITNIVSWTSHMDKTVKKAQQCLFFLRRLRKFVMSIRTLTNFYRCTTESILSKYTMACYSNCSVQTITKADLPSMDFIYTSRCHKKAANMIKDSSHP